MFSILLTYKELNMPTCAIEEKKSDNTPLGNLILTVPDTDFRDFMDEVKELARFAPESIEAMEKDLDANARQKKKLRLEDHRFFEGRTADLPELNIEEQNIVAAELNHAAGRLRMPAVTTILENVNLVSHTTRELNFDKQIAFILQEQWDDFGKLTIDSTSVKANSDWPTDAKILTGLLMRVHRFGLENFRPGWVPRWLEQMDKLEFQICLTAGKRKSKGKLKRPYRQLLKRVLEQIRSDIAEVKRVVQYAGDRIFDDKKLPSTEKALSLSDGSAGPRAGS